MTVNCKYSTITKAEGEAGVTLIELMISLTISMVIILAVVTMLTDASRSHMEVNRSSQMIENGRFAIQQIRTDLRLAGYYGHYFFGNIPTPATLPDPCVTTPAATILSGMALPVQGYNAGSLTQRPDLTATTCTGSFLSDSNLNPGSDILLIRRANTGVFIGTPELNVPYLQSNVSTAEIQFGVTTANVTGAVGSTTADTSVAATMMKVDGTTPADIREYTPRLYFIAPCSIGSGANGLCVAGDDGIPTLKMLELSGGTTTSITITPLAEGIEYMKLSYGVDNSPVTINSTTGMIGDGVPDIYTQTPTLDQWPLVVSVQVNMLARTPSPSGGVLDDKSYNLGGTAITASVLDDNYKRHVFSNEVSLTNMAGPREIP
ncbi:MAG: PilW family protein [Magnetococcales bacterium]|nr:PilW family protein [Magnetococcales bacterium]